MIRLVALALIVASCGGGLQFTEDPGTAVARLTGNVCGDPLVGTAVVIRDELMLTAAHNVAGGDGPMTLTFADGATFDATIVGFDADRDVAFLSTPGLLRHPIRMAEPTAPASGSVVRIHEGSIETIQYTDGELVTAVGHDIYDDKSLINRSTLRFAARIGPGFSGAPVLDRGRLAHGHGDTSLTRFGTDLRHHHVRDPPSVCRHRSRDDPSTGSLRALSKPTNRGISDKRPMRPRRSTALRLQRETWQGPCPVRGRTNRRNRSIRDDERHQRCRLLLHLAA